MAQRLQTVTLDRGVRIIFYSIENSSHAYLSKTVTYYQKIYTFATTGTMLF